MPTACTDHHKVPNGIQSVASMPPLNIVDCHPTSSGPLSYHSPLPHPLARPSRSMPPLNIVDCCPTSSGPSSLSSYHSPLPHPLAHPSHRSHSPHTSARTQPWCIVQCVTRLRIFDAAHFTAATRMALVMFSACLKVLVCLYMSRIMPGWKPERFASLTTFSSKLNCVNCAISTVWI
ncbi:uncharacterized protein F5147DRAFT_432404 [Suillus discolor]|uniref:Uncharacterized protein n=1 Tax=Suillus discolor TaxID=1912936 RepID=A0A9P7FD86_9AGAM|nr:uncharacterized protein F5147DRAFT_432404 [Suillus discolor]KAG2114788.1 hypothetical protein F5147DRAFT_432404 [Suillus discolor]